MSRGDDKVAGWRENAKAARAARENQAQANQRSRGEQRSSWPTGSGGSVGGRHRAAQPGGRARAKDAEARIQRNRVTSVPKGYYRSIWNGKIYPKTGEARPDAPLEKGYVKSVWNGKPVKGPALKRAEAAAKAAKGGKGGKGGKGSGKK